MPLDVLMDVGEDKAERENGVAMLALTSKEIVVAFLTRGVVVGGCVGGNFEWRGSLFPAFHILAQLGATVCCSDARTGYLPCSAD